MLQKPDDEEVIVNTEQSTRKKEVQEIANHTIVKREPNVIYRINRRQVVQDEHGQVIIFGGTKEDEIEEELIYFSTHPEKFQEIYGHLQEAEATPESNLKRTVPDDPSPIEQLVNKDNSGLQNASTGRSTGLFSRTIEYLLPKYAENRRQKEITLEKQEKARELKRERKIKVAELEEQARELKRDGQTRLMKSADVIFDGFGEKKVEKVYGVEGDTVIARGYKSSHYRHSSYTTSFCKESFLSFTHGDFRLTSRPLSPDYGDKLKWAVQFEYLETRNDDNDNWERISRKNMEPGDVTYWQREYEDLIVRVAGHRLQNIKNKVEALRAAHDKKKSDRQSEK